MTTRMIAAVAAVTAALSQPAAAAVQHNHATYQYTFSLTPHAGAKPIIYPILTTPGRPLPSQMNNQKTYHYLKHCKVQAAPAAGGAKKEGDTILSTAKIKIGTHLSAEPVKQLPNGVIRSQLEFSYSKLKGKGFRTVKRDGCSRQVPEFSTDIHWSNTLDLVPGKKTLLMTAPRLTVSVSQVQH